MRQAWRLGAWTLLLVIALAAAWVGFDNFFDGIDTQEWGETADSEAQPNEEDIDAKVLQSLEARGAYLARAGNCVSCHTQAGGTPYAGGRAFETPFGKVFASNLTPDEDTGIGLWNAQHFWRALHHGRSYDGRLLTPVFPYNHTTLITRDDADAMFAFFISLTPVQHAVPPNALRWPYGTQAALAVWRSLYFKPAEFKHRKDQSDEWNRGAYLVQGLGHCAACHSERNALGATPEGELLGGGMMWGSNWYAPSLTDDAQTQLARTPVLETMRLLQTGRNHKQWVTGPMQEVVQNSLQYLSPADLRAMAVYLQTQTQNSLPPAAPKPYPATASVTLRSEQNGALIYENQCAQCHGKQGQGEADKYPALAASPAVQWRNPTNLIQSVLYGGFSVTTLAQPQPYGMPPFVLTLSDRDVADVLTHIRRRWGNQALPVTEFDVTKVRETSAR